MDEITVAQELVNLAQAAGDLASIEAGS